jgi:nitrite reductase/ring-hydroxylating ferredoxin subunit
MTEKAGNKFVKIAKVKEFRAGKTFKFGLKRHDRVTEAFAFKQGEAYYAYLNLCRHWTVGLDYDDNDFFSEDGKLLVCKNHGAVYDPKTGECKGGPCGGASLYKVPLIELDGIVYADVKKIGWGEME